MATSAVGVWALGRLRMTATLVGALLALACGSERTTSGSGDSDPELGGDGFEVRAGSRVGFLGGAESWTLKGGGAHALELTSDFGDAIAFFEHRKSKGEAIARLDEIAAEQPDPSRFFAIGGNPALERVRLAEPVRRGRPSAMKVASEGSEKIPTVTLAIAKDDVVVRVEASLRRAPDQGIREALLRLVDRVRVQVDDGKRAPLRRLGARSVPPAAHGATLGGATQLQQPSESTTVVRAAELEEPGFNGRINSGFGVDAEIEIAVSGDARHIVVVNNSREYTTSNTFGQSFSATQGLVGGPPIANGDPSIAWAQSGAFYFAYIAFPDGSAAAGGVSGCSTGIHSSTDNGQNFAFQSHAFLSPPVGVNVTFPDQEHIAADRLNASSTGGDQVYSVWRDFSPLSPGPMVTCNSISIGSPAASIVCSSDSAGTWTPRAAVGSGDFPRVTVGPDGFVYVVFMSGDNIMLNKFSSCDSGLVQQAGMPVTVASFINLANCGAGGIPGLDRCNSGMDSRSPTVAVSETDPNHVVVAFAHNTAANNENVFVRDSIDGGATFTRPFVQLNASTTGHRFMPWTCVAGDTAFVSWYDMRASVTGASNDLTEFFGATLVRDAGGNLVNNPEFRLSEAPDPLCASGWPGTVRAPVNSENCSVQPQLAGQCGGFGGAGCDFSDCPGVGSAVTACACDTDSDGVQDLACTFGGGIPKYGDYNGAACTGGRYYAAWASRTAAPTDPQPTSIDVFFACPPNANDLNGTFNDTTPPFFDSVPPNIDSNSCDVGPIGQAVAFDVCGDAPAVVTNDAPATFPVGTTVITWTATDAANNSATATQTVTVVDETPPVITPPPNVSVSLCDTSAAVTVGQATATDDCDASLVITGQVIATNGVPLTPPINVVGGVVTLGIGTHTIRWTAFDGFNTSEAFQTVTVGATIQASQSFILQDRAQVLTTTGVGAAVLNGGPGQTRIGNDARSGSVLSAGPVQVLHRAQVQGSVRSAVSVFVEPDATVTGGTSIAPVVLPALPTLPAFPAPTGGSITVNSGTQSPAPGSYTTGTVNGGTLVLAAGDYFFQSLTINSGTTVRATPTTRVFVQTSLAFRSPFRTPGGLIQPIFLGFAGSGTVVMEAPFDGTLVAPNGRVEFGVGAGLTFTGSFFARILELRPASRFVCLASAAPTQPPNPSTCADNIENGTETDVDCGGTSCPRCGVGRNCSVLTDCVSNVCMNGVCAANAGVTATLNVTTDWGGGYCVELNVTNISAQPTTNWSVTLNLGASTTFTTWNGNFSAATGTVNVTPAFSWNQVIPPGGTTNSVGFCANRNAPGVLPSVVSASGTF